MMSKLPLSHPGSAPKKQRSSTQRSRETREAWIILVPILIYYVIFAVFPVVANTYISFTQWNGVTGGPSWVGLDNYLRYFSPPYPQIVFNTALFAVTTMVFSLVVGFGMALLLNQKIRNLGIYRTLWYIPAVTSAAIMAQMVSIFLSPYDGVVNQILTSLGAESIIWQTSPFWMRTIIILFSIWRGVGGTMVLFLAGLQGINYELYEAAMVDGASSRQRTRYITIPLLKPITLFIVVTGIINGFQIFEAVQLISRGGPFNKTNVMILQSYSDAFTNSDFGTASAGATVMALLLLGASIVMLRVMRQEESE